MTYDRYSWVDEADAQYESRERKRNDTIVVARRDRLAQDAPSLGRCMATCITCRLQGRVVPMTHTYPCGVGECDDHVGSHRCARCDRARSGDARHVRARLDEFLATTDVEVVEVQESTINDRARAGTTKTSSSRWHKGNTKGGAQGTRGGVQGRTYVIVSFKTT